VFIPDANSQTGNYEMTAHYTTENGLPQNTISAIVADKDGFIWLGTQSGLTRFDGTNFKVFNTTEIDAGCTNRIMGLAYDNGRLLAIDYGLGVGNYLLEIQNHNTVVKVPYTKRSYHLLTHSFHNIIRAPYINPKISGSLQEEELYIGSDGHEGYTYQLDPKSPRLYYFNIHSGLPPQFVFNCPVRREKSITINSRIYGFDGDYILHGADRATIIPHLSGSLIDLLNGMTLAERELFRFSKSDDKVFFYSNSQVYLLKEVEPGKLDAFLLTKNADIQSVSHFLYLPENQMLLIGTSNSGLYIFRKRAFAGLLLDQHKIGQDVPLDFKINDNMYYNIRPYGDSSVMTKWGIISSSGRRIVNNRLVWGMSDKLHATSQGYYLRNGNTSDPIRYLDSELRELGRFPLSDCHLGHGPRASIFHKDTSYLVYQNKDTVWLKQFVLAKNKPAYEMNELMVVSASAFLNRMIVKSIVKAPNGVFWLGFDWGLCRWNTTTGAITSMADFKNLLVTTLFYDSSGTMWIGTYGKGWYRYREGQPVLALPLDKKKNLSVVHSFNMDSNGFMWISTNNGLFRFFKKDLDSLTATSQPIFYNYFNNKYGFLTNEFNGSLTGPISLKNGNFVFPSMKGLVAFNPLKVPVETVSNTIFIDEILIDTVKLPVTNRLILPPDFNNLTVNLSIPFYGEHYNIQAAYHLSGGEKEWFPIDDNGVIRLNRLTHGKYTLSIRILKGYGSSEFVQRNIEFEVKPFWYQSLWFYIFTLVLAAIITSLAFISRIRSINRHKQKLEDTVKIRTESLAISEDKLRKSLEFRSQITSVVLHDIRSPIYYLSKLTSNLYSTSEGNTTEDIRKQLHALNVTTNKISAYTQNLLSWINAQGDGFTLDYMPILLYDMFMELCERYQPLAEANDTRLLATVSPDLAVMVQPDILEIVVRNILDNAIKFTKDGEVKLTAHETDDAICIIVTDTGIGISGEKIRLLTNNYSVSKSDTRSGMGFRFINDLMMKLEGRIEIKSTVGKGTAVTICLPRKDLIIKEDIL
jgi:signal transduction histidine kinase